MLRPLAILAGLVLLALVVAISLGRETQQHATPAPEPTPSLDGSSAAQESLSATEAGRHDEAGEVVAPDARYVGIVGELKREEDGSYVGGGVIKFSYQYVHRGRDGEVRKVAVDVDEHGRFEQLFSEPVQISSCSIDPALVDDFPEEQMVPARRADFLHATRPIDVLVDRRGTHVGLVVQRGLEIRGRVRDARTAEPVVDALVFVRANLDRALATRTDSRGLFVLLGIDPRLAAPGRDFVDREVTYDVVASLDTFVVCALPRAHRPGKAEVPLPLSATAPAWVELAVPGGFRVSGTVIDSTGKPAVDAAVEVTRKSADTSEFNRELLQLVRTGKDGSFAFDCVESEPGCELRAHAREQGSPAARVDLSSLREYRVGIVFTLPETQVYRIRARKRDGEFLDTSVLSLLIRDPSGERTVSVHESLGALRVALAIGVKSELEISVDTSLPKLGNLYAKTTIEPLGKREEPETIILELEP